MRPSIPVFLFLRSQAPREKTDYTNFVCSPECPLEITHTFEDLHESLHRWSPRLVIVSYRQTAGEVPYLCQTFCRTEEVDGRPILTLIGIAAKVEDLEDAGVNPVELLCSVPFGEIKRNSESYGPLEINPMTYPATELSNQWVERGWQHIQTKKEAWMMEIPKEGLEYPVLSSLSLLMRERNKWIDFCINLPSEVTHFPIELQFVGFEPKRTAPFQRIISEPASSRRRIQTLERLLTEMLKLPAAAPRLTDRLWHLGQDLLLDAELYLAAEDAGGRSMTEEERRLDSSFLRLLESMKRMRVESRFQTELQEWRQTLFPASAEEKRNPITGLMSRFKKEERG